VDSTSSEASLYRVDVATETGADAEITSPNERKIHVH